MSLSTLLPAPLALVFALASPVAAAAATISLTLDPGLSSVSVTNSATGLICLLNSCAVRGTETMPTATYSLGEGDSATFNLFSLTPGALFGSTNYTVSAALAFTGASTATVTGTGGGSARSFLGSFSAGSLTWSNPVQQVTLSDGSVVQVSFASVPKLGGTSDAVAATLQVLSIPAPVPLPAGAGLLVAALGGLAFARRRG